MPTNPQLRLGSGSNVLTVSATDPRRQVLQARARTARLTDCLQTLDGNGQVQFIGINAVYRDRERVCIQTMDGTVHVFAPTQLTMVSRPLNGAAVPTLGAPRVVSEISAGASMVALMQAAPAPAAAPLALPEAASPASRRRSRRGQGGAS